MIKEEDNSANEHTLNSKAVIAVISSSDYVGIDSPAKFRGLRKMKELTAIVAK
jgi:hypothetical protein